MRIVSLLLLFTIVIPVAAQPRGDAVPWPPPDVPGRPPAPGTIPSRSWSGAIPEIIAQPKPIRTGKTETFALPAATPRIRTYNRLHYALYFSGTVWAFLGLGWMIAKGIGARLRAWSERRARHRLLRAALFYATFSLLFALWQLPVSFAAYSIERTYGFAVHPPLLWLLDRGRGYLLGQPNILAVWLGYLLLERSPRRWWLWLWVASIPWTLTMTVLWPVVVAPAYNRFTPLRDAALRAKLLHLADRAGIEGAQVYQVDISRRTTKLNAYVAGIGPTKRIVLWDTTLRALQPDEILAIVGHEMGHYVLGHMWWDFAENVAGALALLWLLSRLLPWAVARLGANTGICSLHDMAGLPLLLLLLYALLFLQTPVESAFSRYHERQADRYGLELTRLNEATARAFAAFVKRDYADPDPPPFIVFWLYSHPPLRERVRFALEYRPWERRTAETQRRGGSVEKQRE